MSRTTKWETRDIMFQSLYHAQIAHIESERPLFGSGILLPLTNGGLYDYEYDATKKIPDFRNVGKREPRATQPTILNFVWHFNMMEWAYENLKDLMKKSKGTIKKSDLNENFFNYAQGYVCKKFENEVIVPHRKAYANLRHPLYLYTIPSVMEIIHETTGTPLQVSGERVVTLLPQKVETAKFYGLSEAEIKILASQVLWCVKNMCGYKVIDTPKKLEIALDQWPEYIDEFVLNQLRNEILMEHQNLISETTQKLLPCADGY